MMQKIPRHFWTAAFILICMAVAFALRAVPALFIGDNSFLYTYDTDTWYTLRQVEVMVSQYPAYPWFDPMTAFPDGKLVSWGPLFPFVASTLCLVFGATTKAAIIGMAGWISPVLATLMIPVLYVLGKTVWDERAGLVAAGLATVLSFRFFFFSMYGYVDHHIMELFFSTLFLTGYAGYLVYTRKNPPNPQTLPSLKVPVALAALCGFLYFLALITSTTVLLVIPIIAFFTFVRMVLDYFAGHDSLSIVILNGVAFSAVILLLMLFGIDGSTLSFTGYSLGLVLVILAVLAATLVLGILCRICRGKPLFFGAGIAVLAFVAAGIFWYLPAFQSISTSAWQLLLGPSAFSTVVQETLPWSVSTAWANFNLAIILMAAGLLILAYHSVRAKKTEHIFFLIWSIVMLFATVRYRRFEYYSTVNIILLTAICITEPFRLAGEDFWQRIRSFMPVPGSADKEATPDTAAAGGEEKKSPHRRSGKRKKKDPAATGQKFQGTLIPALCILMIIVVFLMIAISALQDYDYATGTSTRRISADWIESLDWLSKNSPDTGVDYYRVYEKTSFAYPQEAYGIMASWSSGHWITFFSHRIPITNPFQDNLAGPSGAAAYFLSDREPAANTILSSRGGRYVITDTDLAVDTFSSLIPWQNNSVDISPYVKWFLVPSETNPSRLEPVSEYDNAYYQTMAVRLHVFDGSQISPGEVHYIEYTIRNVPAAGETADVSGPTPVISRMVVMNASAADEAAKEFNRNAAPNRRAIVLSDSPDKPVAAVPALAHYRLVHESPENATVTRFEGTEPVTLPGVKAVKIFEYVSGAQIRGTGIIEVPVKTNAGRIFVYRQESVNGTFTVPYPTTGSSSEVQAQGGYHILGTDRYVTVTENDVSTGATVAG